MPDTAGPPPEYYIEQLRRIAAGLGWTVKSTEVLEGDSIRVTLLHLPESK